MWWTRQAHALVGLLVAMTAAVGIATQDPVFVYLVPVTIALDAVVGVVVSLIKQPFDKPAISGYKVLLQ